MPKRKKKSPKNTSENKWYAALHSLDRFCQNISIGQSSLTNRIEKLESAVRALNQKHEISKGESAAVSELAFQLKDRFFKLSRQGASEHKFRKAAVELARQIIGDDT